MAEQPPPLLPPTTPKFWPTSDHPVLLIGGSGYVGQRFAAHLRLRGWPFRAPSRQDLHDWGQQSLSTGIKGASEQQPILGTTDFLPLLERWEPCLVINAAGVTGKPTVDWCEATEANRQTTWAGNVTLVKHLGEACRAAGVPLGHVSSGCVYQGDGVYGEGWKESDTPHTRLSYYSKTKLAGESILATSQKESWIWRLRVPFDHRDGERNYLSKLQRYGRLVEVRNSLSQLDHFVWGCLECYARQVPYGTYHLTNPGSVDTAEVVELIRSQRGIQLPSWEPDWFTSVEQFQSVVGAIRSSCVLNTDKAAGVGIVLPEVRVAIRVALAHWVRAPHGD